LNTSLINRSRTLTCAAALSAALLLIATGCGKAKDAADSTGDGKESTAPVKPAAPPGVVVLAADAPELKEMKVEEVHNIAAPAQAVTATARIEANPNRVAHAVVPAPGRITRLMVKLGDSVQQGQPLVAIESSAVTELESAYVQAGSMIRQAELALSKSESDLSRVTDLFEHQAVAQKEVVAAQSTVAINKTSLDQAKAGQDQARRRLELLGLKTGEFQQQIVVTAPISGKVLEVSVVEGEYRNEINAPLMTISDLSRVWATSEVPESEIANCRIGGIVDLELISFPNEVFHARVTRIADTVNSDTRTIKVSAELDNPGGKLRPEMFGKLHYENGTTPMPWVPTSAVVRIGSKDFVFVEQDKGHFLSTQVELGQPTQGGFPINAGVKTGDRVVTQGSIYLKAAL
jgi:cobalt-zinc-cadmium efflux system membrane fusion protein